MVDLICPKGMVLISGDKGPFRRSPFCIHITEVPQEDDNRFWAKKREESGYQEVRRDKPSPGKDRDRMPLSRVEAGKAMERNKDRVRGEMHPKLQPTGNSLGPRKPAVLRTWLEARQYCQESYPGGDLPTWTQWRMACWNRDRENYICTASGELKKTEARFGEPEDAGPVDVDSYPPNANGVKNLVGNVGEWILHPPRAGGFKVGGSWMFEPGRYKIAGLINALLLHPGQGFSSSWNWLGYRCIASPQPPE